MNIDTITSNTNEIVTKDKKSVFTHGVFDLGADSSVRTSLSTLNSDAYEVHAQEASAYQATYKYVAALVDAAHDYKGKPNVAAEFNKVFATLFGDPKDGDKETNPFLRLVRTADGAWDTQKGRNGGFVVKWKPNRSGEKYAAVCRFAVTNGYTGAKLLNLLGGKEKIEYSHNGETLKTDPTINGIIAADRKQQEVATRAVLDTVQWGQITNLAPLASVEMTASMAEKFTNKEEGLALAAVIIRDGRLFIIGDSGKDDNEVQRLFKKQFIAPDKSKPEMSIPSASEGTDNSKAA